MCGRFTLTASAQRLRERFALAAAPEPEPPRYNIAPTQPVLVIPNRDTRLLRPARWGLIPSWAKEAKAGNAMINARAESVATRAPFRDALARHRCLIPADGFYEWQRDGRVRRPFYFQLRDRQPLAFAGLWGLWRSRGGETIVSCTIITAPANALLRPIHDRMPVILHPDAWQAWLDPQALPPAELMPLLTTAPDDWLDGVEVSPRVNSAANDGPECIAPLEPGGERTDVAG